MRSALLLIIAICGGLASCSKLDRQVIACAEIELDAYRLVCFDEAAAPFKKPGPLAPTAVSALPAYKDQAEEYCSGISVTDDELNACVAKERAANQAAAARPVIQAARSSIPDSIRQYCQRIVGDSYQLMEVCINQEMGARARIQ